MRQKFEGLTDREVRNAKCPKGQYQIDIFDKSLPGFGLRVTSAGAKSFFLKYVSPEILIPAAVNKKTGKLVPEHYQHRRLPCGIYFEDGSGTSLDEARKIARNAKDMIAPKGGERGRDPLEQMIRDGQAKDARKTVSQIYTTWSAWTLARNDILPGTAKKSVGIAKNHIIPTLGAYHIADVNGSHYDELFLPHIEKANVNPKHRGVANHVHLCLNDMFDFAVTRSAIPFNPFASHENAFKKRNKGSRFFDRDEIKRFWEVTAGMNWEHAGPILRLLLATGQRIGAVCLMKRSNIDQEKRLWLCPIVDMKNGERKQDQSDEEMFHPVPLNPIAWSIVEQALKDAKGDFLFTKVNGKPMTGGRIDQIVKDAQLAFGMPKWVPHVCRHTFITWGQRKAKKGGCGLKRTDVKRAIGHAVKEEQDTMGKVYTHIDELDGYEEFLDEIAAVQEGWGLWLESAIHPADGGSAMPVDGNNVVMLRPAA